MLPLTSAVTATFNESVQASTIGFTLTNSSGGTVAATVTYNSATDTATLTPSRVPGLRHDLHGDRQWGRGYRGRCHEYPGELVVHHGFYATRRNE